MSGFKCVPTREIRNKFFKVKRFEDRTLEKYIFYYVMRLSMILRHSFFIQ